MCETLTVRPAQPLNKKEREDKLNSVSILGKALTSKLCKFDTDEVWGVNNVGSHPEFLGKKIDKLFAFDILPKEYTDDMKKYAPVCSWQEYADLKYPLEEIKKEFKSEFFTNTVTYMIAYAIYLKVKRIEIYGVDVAFGAPYVQENRGVEFWLGRAVERGIDVYAPSDSQLMRTMSGNIYGDPDHCNMQLYLHERINLINMLPRQGHYEEAIKAQNAWWVLFPKEDEAQLHGVKVQRSPDGSMSFQSEKGEFLSDIHMPPEVWEYLRNLMIENEKKGTLSFSTITMYEKLVLAKPPGGN